VCARVARPAWSRGPSAPPLERTMLSPPLTPRRKLALGIALPWVAFMFAFGFYTLQSGAGPPPFAYWHFVAIAAWVAASSLASGLVITELSRLTVRSSPTWSDKRHFRIALFVSLGLLVVQSLSVMLAFHGTSACAF
jgi:hypothetical protein